MNALYVRVSTQEQAESGYSIEEQSDRLTKYCEAMNYGKSKLYTDAGFSGGSMDRPALQSMIRDVKAGKVERVIVYKLDRLSRSQLDTLYLIEKVFLENECDFVSMSENFDTGTPFGRAMIGILAVFAQLEREQIRERLQMGKYARAKEGKFNGSHQIPIGYDYKDGELVTNYFEKAQVIQIYEDYAAGMSPPAIADKLNAAGMYQKNGRWLPYTIRQIIDRKTYLGYSYYKGEWFKGSHEAFIPLELWERCQRIRQQKADEHKRHNRRSGKANSYLGGFCICKRCGEKYFRAMQYTHGKEKAYFYKCGTKSGKIMKEYRRAPSCDNKNWKCEELERIIFGEIEKLATEPDTMNGSYARISADREKAIGAELKEIERKTDRLMDLYTDGAIPKGQLNTRIHALADQREKLAAELEGIAEKRKEKTSPEAALPLVRSFGDVIRNGDLDEARAVIGSLIDKIELDGDDVKIYWRF